MPKQTHSHHDWQQTIFLRYGQKILDRCRDYYAQLAALPRATRRKLKTATGMGLTALALALALAGSPTPAHAATITVDGTTCNLAQAITTANDGSVQGSCTQGDGAGPDTLNITADITLNSVLPDITSEMTIEGNGHTIARDGGAPEFRIFTVTSAGNLTLENATVQGGRVSNTAGDAFGGGILTEGSLTVRDSTITGNTVEITTPTNAVAYYYASGGGIAAEGGTAVVTIESSLINNNSSTSANNRTFGTGGGVSARGGAGATIENSTLTANSSINGGEYGGGGGAFISDGTMSILYSTITGNTASASLQPNGGGVYGFAYSATTTINLTNNIITDNTANGTDSQPNCRRVAVGQIIDGNTVNSLIGGGECGGTDPTALNLGTLGDNGGPTQTIALLAGSADAIDAIPTSDATCTAGVSSDQRGAVRAGGTATTGGSDCDIGASEYNSDFTPTAVANLQALQTSEPAPTGMVASVLAAMMLALGTAWAAVRRP